MENKVCGKNLALLDEPLFSLAFGDKEHFQLLWSLMTGDMETKVMEMYHLEKKRSSAQVLSAIGVDEEKNRHILSIVRLDLEEEQNLLDFVQYIGDVLLQNSDRTLHAPWFLVFLEANGRSREFELFQEGDGIRNLQVNYLVRGEKESIGLKFGFSIVDLTAKTLEDGWHPVSKDLLETKPKNIHIPELRRLLSLLKEGSRKTETKESLLAISDEQQVEVRKRLEELGFSKDEVEEMLR